MLDLRNMSDEESTMVVAPSVPQASAHITVNEEGQVLLSSKAAGIFANKPVQLRFNRDFTAIQLALTEEDPNSVIFPKNGRRKLPNAAELLKRNHIPFPAVFQGCFFQEFGKWRGERQQNPTVKSSASTRSTKKK